MAFQIHNNLGQVQDLYNMDKLAAEFWGVQYDPKEWASPNPDSVYSLNWKDLIGFQIHKGATTWGMVDLALSNLHSNPAYLPFRELMTYWAELGYVPVPVRD